MAPHAAFENAGTKPGLQIWRIEVNPNVTLIIPRGSNKKSNTALVRKTSIYKFNTFIEFLIFFINDCIFAPMQLPFFRLYKTSKNPFRVLLPLQCLPQRYLLSAHVVLVYIYIAV